MKEWRVWDRERERERDQAWIVAGAATVCPLAAASAFTSNPSFSPTGDPARLLDLLSGVSSASRRAALRVTILFDTNRMTKAPRT